MILILTDQYDLHADRVVEALGKKGKACIRFDPGTFLERSQVALRYSSGQGKALLQLEDASFELQEIATVWNRRPHMPRAPKHLAEHDQRLVRDESAHLTGSLWQLMQHSFWVNPCWPERAAQYKPYQLHVASELGLDIPRTLVTNNPVEAVAFFEKCNGEMIYKTLSGHTRDFGTTGFGIYSTQVTRQDLDDHSRAISLAPCQFQEYVPKKVELRITIIGHRVFAAEMDTQSDERSRVDWRRNLMETSLPYREVELPAEFHDRLLTLMKRLGLVFGCIDVIVTPDDRFVFLEINTAGQWIWIEEHTGMPLIHNFTNMLIQATPKYDALRAGL